MKTIIKTLFIKIDLLIQSSKKRDNPTEILLNVPYIHGDFGNCGIISAEMMIRMLGRKLPKGISEYKSRVNYIENIGWKHQGLANIISEESGRRVAVFKNKSYLFVLDQLAKGIPVIVSIFIPAPDNLSKIKMYKRKDTSKPLEGHMVICVGYDKDNIILHDPRNIGIYSKNLKVSKDVFQRIFRGNGIA